jgi:hypothetical protein
MSFLPPQMLQGRECTPTLSSSIVFMFGLTFECFKEFGGVSNRISVFIFLLVLPPKIQVGVYVKFILLMLHYPLEKNQFSCGFIMAEIVCQWMYINVDHGHLAIGFN